MNYWGYQPVSFFAPHHAYSSQKNPLAVLDEFRDMVKALPPRGPRSHPRRCLQSHHGRWPEAGPTLCYRGLANDFYYILEKRQVPLRRLYRLRQHAECQPADRAPADPGQPALLGDADACGRIPLRSRLDPVARREGPPAAEPARSLGHRIGSVAGRHQADCGGVGCCGALSGGKLHRRAWQEWNGRFRDDVRRFLRGDNGSVSGVASRILGSPDIYGHEEREAEQSINFVTCHDGFTLNDLVSYNHKHNEANGENNRDGSDDNLSWNCGAEGPTDDPTGRGAAQPPGQELLRTGCCWRPGRRCCSWATRCAGPRGATITPTARTPISAGSTGACWSGTATSTASSKRSTRFANGATSWRKGPRLASINSFAGRASSGTEWRSTARIGATTRTPWPSRSEACAARFLLHGMLNAYWEPLTFELPPVPAERQQAWRRCIDTALELAR